MKKRVSPILIFFSFFHSFLYYHHMSLLSYGTKGVKLISFFCSTAKAHGVNWSLEFVLVLNKSTIKVAFLPVKMRTETSDNSLEGVGCILAFSDRFIFFDTEELLQYVSGSMGYMSYIPNTLITSEKLKEVMSVYV